MDEKQSLPVARITGNGPNWSREPDRHSFVEAVLVEVSAWLVKLCALVVIAGISVLIWGLSQGDRE